MRLGELISKAKVERCGDRSLPVYSMTMHDGIVEQSERFKKAIASKDLSSYKVVRKNQLVVGFPIDEGVLYVQNHDRMGIMSPAYSVWDFDIEKILPAYLELALHSPQSMAYYAAKMRGTTARRRTLTAENLCALEIPLPTVERQREISAIFERIKVSMSINVLELEKLDALVKSRFIELFGDPENTIYRVGTVEDIADVTVGVVIKPKRYYTEDSLNGVKAFRSLNVGEMHVKDSDWVYFTREGNQECSKSMLKEGDVLIVRSGYPGTSCVVPIEFEGCNAVDLIIARPDKSQITPGYLAAFNNGNYVKNLVARQSVGSAQKHFNVGFYKKMKLPIPPIEVQMEFIDFMRQVDKSKSIARKQIEKLQLLYDSLAQEYFGD